MDISKLEPNDTTKVAMLELEVERLRAALEDCSAELFGGKDGSPARLDPLLERINRLLHPEIFTVSEQNAPVDDLANEISLIDREDDGLDR